MMLLGVDVKHAAAAAAGRGTSSKIFCTHLIIGTGSVCVCVCVCVCARARGYVIHYAGEGEGMITGQDKL
jgi:hypothetical protein